MKTSKIAVAAMAVLCAVSLVSSCHKVKEQEKPVVEQETEFTVALNTVDAEYAEIVVRHTGAKDVTWFGFVTEDVTTAEQDLINSQVAKLDKKSLHVGNSQTVAVRGLNEKANYRYIAFAVNASNEVFGKPGSLSFFTTPVLKVGFNAEVGEVKSHAASFTISHEGDEVLTYTCFVTTDTNTSAKDLAQADFAYNVTDGKLNEELAILNGNSLAVTIDELKDETSYRFIVYGIFNNNGKYMYYGTPADVSFTTPIDPARVQFSAKAKNVTNTTADIEVSYSATDNTLTWYGFLTEDVTTDASTLIASKVASVTEADWQVGPKTISLTGLTKDTEYRYIVTGINADGVYGQCGEVKFVAFAYIPSYEDYLGSWKFGGNTISVSQKVAGSTYTVTGLPGLTSLYGTVHEVVANYNGETHEFSIMEQKLGAFDTADVPAFGSNQYGVCDDYLSGVFAYSTSYYPAYPYNTSSAACIFTVALEANGEGTLTAGTCEHGAFIGLDFWWIIRTGTYAGKGNSYHASSDSFTYEPLPATMVKIGTSSSVAVSSCPVAPVSCVVSQNYLVK